jgi:hypothetical protein
MPEPIYGSALPSTYIGRGEEVLEVQSNSLLVSLGQEGSVELAGSRGAN